MELASGPMSLHDSHVGVRIHSQEEMTQLVRHHVTHNLGWIDRIILRQPYYAGIENVGLHAPAVGTNEGNSEVLPGKIERSGDDSYKELG
jgi:hypothetical protein